MPEIQTKQPNVLILMSDEHRADIAGFAGNNVVRTPNLDWLSETGVTFSNAYTPSPVCIPARQSIMAGQYPHTTGCEHFHQDLSPEYMTYSRRFTQYGYSTVCAGKLHHRGKDQMQGWISRIGGDTKLNGEYTERLVGNIPKSDYSGKWSDAKEIAKAGIGCGPHQEEDQYVLQGTLNFIRRFFIDSEYDCATPNHPLMLKVSFCRPHYPYFTDKERFEYYLNRVEPFADQLLSEHTQLSTKSVVPGVDACERDIRRAVAAYYGMVDSMDSDFGKILNALRFAGQDLDDWIIVYMSDHGEMLGEHSVWEKFKFYEGSARVPLVIRWPRGFDGGHTRSENVNLCDLFATLCDLCDIPVPDGLDSRSLVPLMRNEASTVWDNVSYSEHVASQLMIKRDALKYQWFGPDIPEVLFDLEHDPSENTDFINDVRYADALARFRAERKDLGFGVSDIEYEKPFIEPSHAG
ncbi:sulfatase-like hydrolase/transferase [Rubellicoccus peritrichatus]|uniref:Sulfatase-like hydrolase/transferase n=1 Tax=Rubellicoccus peritrichatus TaxID=3080537 RepID=A0AAQ3L6U9_9BACT|nr:sulfatase-like hydrolase/transferase [Puniceicoccus sp. CR14]WOO39747.1 sulfatase-like hydrolase/transferase [Puniceicoccus sp. CR14]